MFDAGKTRMMIKNDLENEVNLKKINSYNTVTGFEHMTYAIKPEHLAHWAMAAFGDIGLKVSAKASTC